VKLNETVFLITLYVAQRTRSGAQCSRKRDQPLKKT